MDFIKHSPASSPPFDGIEGSIDLAFGNFNFRASHVGILRLEDSTRSPATRSIEPKKIARWADDEDEIGSEPDSPSPTHPHLRFVAMVKRAPRTDSEGETGIDDEDPDAELGNTNTKNPPEEYSGAAAEGDEQLAGTESKSKKIKEARPQILVTPDVIKWVNSLIAQGAALPKDATTEEKLTYQYKLNQRKISQKEF